MAESLAISNSSPEVPQIENVNETTSKDIVPSESPPARVSLDEFRKVARHCFYITVFNQVWLQYNQYQVQDTTLRTIHSILIEQPTEYHYIGIRSMWPMDGRLPQNLYPDRSLTLENYALLDWRQDDQFSQLDFGRTFNQEPPQQQTASAPYVPPHRRNLAITDANSTITENSRKPLRYQEEQSSWRNTRSVPSQNQMPTEYFPPPLKCKASSGIELKRKFQMQHGYTSPPRTAFTPAPKSRKNACLVATSANGDYSSVQTDGQAEFLQANIPATVDRNIPTNTRYELLPNESQIGVVESFGGNHPEAMDQNVPSETRPVGGSEHTLYELISDPTSHETIELYDRNVPELVHPNIGQAPLATYNNILPATAQQHISSHTIAGTDPLCKFTPTQPILESYQDIIESFNRNIPADTTIGENPVFAQYGPQSPLVRIESYGHTYQNIPSEAIVGANTNYVLYEGSWSLCADPPQVTPALYDTGFMQIPSPVWNSPQDQFEIMQPRNEPQLLFREEESNVDECIELSNTGELWVPDEPENTVFGLVQDCDTLDMPSVHLIDDSDLWVPVNYEGRIQPSNDVAVIREEIIACNQAAEKLVRSPIEYWSPANILKTPRPVPNANERVTCIPERVHLDYSAAVQLEISQTEFISVIRNLIPESLEWQVKTDQSVDFLSNVMNRLYEQDLPYGNEYPKPIVEGANAADLVFVPMRTIVMNEMQEIKSSVPLQFVERVMEITDESSDSMSYYRDFPQAVSRGVAVDDVPQARSDWTVDMETEGDCAKILAEMCKSSMSALHDLARFNDLTASYRLVNKEGVEHAPLFTVKLYLGVEVYQAQGTSHRKALHNVAMEALIHTQYSHPAKKTVKEKAARKFAQTETANEHKAPEMPNEDNAPNPERFYPNATCELYEISRACHSPLQFDMLCTIGQTPEIIFFLTCKFMGFVSFGQGNSKKEAKRKASVEMLHIIDTLKLRPSMAAKRDKPPPGRRVRLDPIDGAATDTISALNQYQQRCRGPYPVYEVHSLSQEESGSPKSAKSVKVRVGNKYAIGTGPNKRAAKQAAAELLLNMLTRWN